MTALAIALAFATAVAGLLAWRWMSLTYTGPEPIQLDGESILKAMQALNDKAQEHESKLNALMLERGLRTSKESRA